LNLGTILKRRERGNGHLETVIIVDVIEVRDVLILRSSIYIDVNEC